MATKYRVAYKDGRKQETTADKYQIEGNFFIFYTGGVPTLTVAADLVEHVAEADALGPESSGPIIA